MLLNVRPENDSRSGLGPPTWSAGFVPVGLGALAGSYDSTSCQLRGSNRCNIFSPAGLTNRQRPNGAGLLLVVDCDSGAAGLKWPAMSTKSREVIWGGRIMPGKPPRRPSGKADRAEAKAWSVRMEGYGGPVQPSPTIAQCLSGGLGWLEVEYTAARRTRACRSALSADRGKRGTLARSVI